MKAKSTDIEESISSSWSEKAWDMIDTIKQGIFTKETSTFQLDKVSFTQKDINISLVEDKEKDELFLKIDTNTTTAEITSFSATAEFTKIALPEPMGPYTLINRLKQEGRFDELMTDYDLIDIMRKNGQVVDRSTVEGIVQLIEDQQASFGAESFRQDV